MQQTYRTTPMQKSDFNKVALQFYWNHTLAWLFSCRFAAYFHKIFSEEHPRTAASPGFFQMINVILRKGLAALWAWFPPPRSHWSAWAKRFDRLIFISQSSLPEHSHQLPSLSAKFIVFYKIGFSQLSTFFVFVSNRFISYQLSERNLLSNFSG